MSDTLQFVVVMREGLAPMLIKSSESHDKLKCVGHSGQATLSQPAHLADVYRFN